MCTWRRGPWLVRRAYRVCDGGGHVCFSSGNDVGSAWKRRRIGNEVTAGAGAQLDREYRSSEAAGAMAYNDLK